MNRDHETGVRKKVEAAPPPLSSRRRAFNERPSAAPSLANLRTTGLRHAAKAAGAPLLLCLLAPAVRAQMVSAPDMGFLRTELTRDMMYAEAGYSITPVLAAGPAWYRIDGAGGPTLDAFTANTNWLAWRQNNRDSQANLYLGAGAGGLLVDKTEEEAVGAGLIQADWENRRWHVMYQGQALFNDRRFHLMNIVHAGWAPWTADYDEIAPWIYLRGGYTTGRDADINLGATLVLMYKNILVEAGADTHGNPIAGLRCLFSF